MSKILHGKPIADKVIADCKARVEKLKAGGFKPGLAFILVGDDRASHTYVRLKRKLCAKIGIESRLEHMDEGSKTRDVIEMLRSINDDPNWHAVLVQLPLPKGLNVTAVLSAINPRKDVDGLHPLNQGLLACNVQTQAVPCTPLGCMMLIDEAGVSVDGKFATVIGRSRIVGRPMATMLTNAGATVTCCHTKTKNLGPLCRRADILVVAAGSPKLVDGSMIKENALVLDVGINHENGSVVGDVDTESASEVAATITPVPGGVGPMTLAMLMRNTVELASRQAPIKGQ